MTKSSKDKIDEDTQLILNELQKNANKSINEIANKLDFSRQKVWRIIKNLEKDHTIWGYTAIVNEEKKGLTHYILLIKRTLRPLDKKLGDQIVSSRIEELVPKVNVEVEHSYYTHGSYDWIMCFKTNDIKNAKLFCEFINKAYLGYIQSYELVQIMFPIRVQGITNPEIGNLQQFIMNSNE